MTARADSSAGLAPPPSALGAALAFARTHAFALGLLGAALAAIVVRLPFLTWPLISDEGGYAYTAYWWLRGLTLYSDQLWYDKPQGIFLIYAAGLSLLGWDVQSIRLLGGLAAVADTLGLCIVARRLFDRRVAVVASWIGALALAAPHIEGYTANAEIFMIFPLTLGAYLLLNRRWFWAGVLAAIAVLIKPSGAAGLLLAGFCLLQTRARSRAWLAFALGAALPTTVALGHAALTVGIDTYLYSLVLYRAGAWTPALDQLLVLIVVTGPVWVPLAGMSLFGVRGVSRRELVFMLMWLAASLLGVASGGLWNWHYITQVVPPLAVLAAVGLCRLWNTGATLVRAEVVLIPLAFLIVFEVSLAFMSPQDGTWALFKRPGYRVAESAAAYIAQHSSPTDSVYVAFSEADIYHLARRRAAVPYIFQFQLVHYPDAYNRLLTVIAQRQPLYVLALGPRLPDVDPDDSFMAVLAQGYEVVTYFEDVPLYRRRAESGPAVLPSGR